MARTPINTRLVRTSAEVERGQVLIENLCRLFLPHVEPVAKPKILALLTEPIHMGEDEVANTLSAVKEGIAEGAIYELTPEALVKLEAELRNPPPMPPEEIEATMAEEINNATASLVTDWFNCVYHAVPGNRDDARELSTATIGDDMFPPLDAETAALFDECCAPGVLTSDEARGILRAVRASLPEGKCLPDEAVELLSFYSVTVR